MVKIKSLNHGRETYAVYYGKDLVLKRPLPNMGQAAMDAWLVKQHKTQTAIDRIRAVGNPLYNVPEMRFINDDEYQILEERAPGQPLGRDLYRKLSRRQRFEIINSLGSFLVDADWRHPNAQNCRRIKVQPLGQLYRNQDVKLVHQKRSNPNGAHSRPNRHI